MNGNKIGGSTSVAQILGTTTHEVAQETTPLMAHREVSLGSGQVARVFSLDPLIEAKGILGREVRELEPTKWGKVKGFFSRAADKGLNMYERVQKWTVRNAPELTPVDSDHFHRGLAGLGGTRMSRDGYLENKHKSWEKKAFTEQWPSAGKLAVKGLLKWFGIAVSASLIGLATGGIGYGLLAAMGIAAGGKMLSSVAHSVTARAQRSANPYIPPDPPGIKGLRFKKFCRNFFGGSLKAAFDVGQFEFKLLFTAIGVDFLQGEIMREQHVQENLEIIERYNDYLNTAKGASAYADKLGDGADKLQKEVEKAEHKVQEEYAKLMKKKAKGDLKPSDFRGLWEADYQLSQLRNEFEHISSLHQAWSRKAELLDKEALSDSEQQELHTWRDYAALQREIYQKENDLITADDDERIEIDGQISELNVRAQELMALLVPKAGSESMELLSDNEIEKVVKGFQKLAHEPMLQETGDDEFEAAKHSYMEALGDLRAAVTIIKARGLEDKFQQFEETIAGDDPKRIAKELCSAFTPSELHIFRGAQYALNHIGIAREALENAAAQ